MPPQPDASARRRRRDEGDLRRSSEVDRLRTRWGVEQPSAAALNSPDPPGEPLPRRPRTSSFVRRARIGLLVPGSDADRAARGLLGLVALLAVALAVVLPGDAELARATGWAVPLLAVVAGYTTACRASLADAAGAVLARYVAPYLSWLVLLGVPLMIWEASRSLPASWPRLVQLLVGPDPGAPLDTHWIVAALAWAVLLVAAAERLLRVHAGWLLPAAVALAYVAPRWAELPLALGPGLALAVFVVAGRILRAARGRIGWRTGVVLALAGLAAAVGPAGPLALHDAATGVPVGGPLAAIAAGAGLVLLAERVALHLPRTARTLLAEYERVALVGLLTVGVGAFLLAEAPAVVAYVVTVAIALLLAALVAALRHSALLTGTSTADA